MHGLHANIWDNNYQWLLDYMTTWLHDYMTTWLHDYMTTCIDV